MATLIGEVKKVFTRRQCIGCLIAAALIGTLGGAAFAAGADSVTLLIHPTLYLATGGEGGLIDEFIQETGIDVEVVTAPTEQLWEKAVVEFFAGTGRYDVVSLIPTWITDEIADFLEPLDEFLDQTEPGYSADDIIPSLLTASTVNGQLYAMPMRAGTGVLYYRKDILSRYEIAPPKSLDEYMRAAAALTQDVDSDGQVDIYGVVMRGMGPNEFVEDFARVLYAHGGDFFDSAMEHCTLNNREGVQALRYFTQLYTDGYAPPDTLALGRDDQIRLLQTGRAAMGLFFSPYYTRIVENVDPSVIGWDLIPTADGVVPGRTFQSGWALSIDSSSDQKAAAWRLVEYLTGPSQQLEMALKYSNAPVRRSVYEDASFTAQVPAAETWLRATEASVSLPRHPRWAEMVQAVAVQLTQVMQGRSSVEAAASSMCRQLEDLLR